MEEYESKMISFEDNKHYVAEIQQQNKRYHEAFEIVLQTMATPYWFEMKDAIVKTLLRALESEE